MERREEEQAQRAVPHRDEFQPKVKLDELKDRHFPEGSVGVTRVRLLVDIAFELGKLHARLEEIDVARRRLESLREDGWVPRDPTGKLP